MSGGAEQVQEEQVDPPVRAEAGVVTGVHRDLRFVLLFPALTNVHPPWSLHLRH